MITLNKILVPTDFSDFSNKALDYAMALAKAHDAEVLVLHVTAPPSYPVETSIAAEVYEEIEDRMRQDAEKRLAEILEGEDARTVATHTRVAEGSPFVQIIRIAREEDVDLIVIATHGVSGIKHLLLGSTAEKVVRKAPCPVLTVKDKGREFVLP